MSTDSTDRYTFSGLQAASKQLMRNEPVWVQATLFGNHVTATMVSWELDDRGRVIVWLNYEDTPFYNAWSLDEADCLSLHPDGHLLPYPPTVDLQMEQ